jgi:hypothetical protein
MTRKLSRTRQFLMRSAPLAVLAIAACAPGDSERLVRPAYTVDTIDSRLQSLPTIQLIEQARLDGMAADLVRISPIGGMTITSDNGLALTQLENHQVLFINADGKVSGAFGRRGAGPGEFTGIFTMGVLGDTVWVGDNRLRRATLIGPNRKLVRTLNIPAVLTGAKLAERPEVADAPAMIPLIGLQRDTFVGVWLTQEELLIRATLAGKLVNTLPVLEEANAHWVRMPNGGRADGDLFDFTRRFDVSANARLIAIARPVTTHSSAASTVTVLRPSGDTVFVRLIEFEGTRIPQSVVDQAIARRVRDGGAELMAAYRRDAYVPPFFLPITDVLLTDHDYVWLRLQPRNNRQEYLVLNPSGGVFGRASFPLRTTAGAAEEGVVWVVESNEFDVPSIVKYGITKRP